MPMPELDPSRFYAAVLADPSHKLPLPGPGAPRFFPDEGAVVDSADAFYAQLIADGSLVRKLAPTPEDVVEPEKSADDPAPAVAPKADALAPAPGAASKPAAPAAPAPDAPAPKA